MTSDTQRMMEKMRAEWDQRARENAYHHIASEREAWSEQEFESSGRSSVQHAIVDDLARIAGDRDPKSMTMLEIGCGAGRMTGSLAELFGEVHAVDVSGEMIAKARERLADVENVRLYQTDGLSLSALGDLELDFALSYIVFQHIPKIEVIHGYIRQVAERLRPGAVFKFQVQGNPLAEAVERDTWNGVRFSALDAIRAARAHELRIEAFEGVGQQYFWLTARKEPGRGPELDALEQDLLEAESEMLNAALARLGGDLQEVRRWADEKAAEVQRAVERADEMESVAQDLQGWLDEKVQEVERAVERAGSLEAERDEAREKLHNEVRRAAETADALRAHLRELYGSWAYRIGRRFGAAPEMIQEKDPD